MIKPEDLTDEMIRELMNVDRSDGARWLTCEIALGHGRETQPKNVRRARELCADLYNSFGLGQCDADREAAEDAAREADEREAAKHETEEDRLDLRSMWSVR